MPAYAEEIEEAIREGVELHELVAPVRVVGEDGKVTGIEMTRMRLGDADETGRRRPEPIEGSAFVVACDMVLPAIGQSASADAAGTLEMSRRLTVVSDPVTLSTSRAGVFAGGDVVSGGGTVIGAIADGQRAAVAIDRHLGGPGVLPPDISLSLYRASDAELAQAPPRLKESMAALKNRLADFREVVRGVSRKGACAEAGRCLRCDLEKLKS
jgi:NADPH-dependent glutamate synthase beta subunit-like oxidoreductase